MPTPRLPIRACPPTPSIVIPRPATTTLILLVLVALVPLLVASPAAADPAVWRWPMAGPPRIVRPFAPPLERWLAGHRGMDLAAPPATPILAAGAGTVRYAGRLAGRGVVSVEHPGGLRTTYLPVAPSVRPGQHVSPGDLLGTLEAATGHCAESCLHWGLIQPPRYLDPLLLLGRARIRLLPFWDPAPTTGEMMPPHDPHPGSNGSSIPRLTQATNGTPAAQLITTTTPPETPRISEIVPPGYTARTSQHPTTRTTSFHQTARPGPRIAGASPAYHNRPHDHVLAHGHGHAQDHDGAQASDLPPPIRSEPKDRDTSQPEQAHGEEQGSALKQIHDEEEPGNDPELGHHEEPVDADSDAAIAAGPGRPTSATSTLPPKHPGVHLTGMTSSPPCTSPSVAPTTPNSASAVWSLGFPHGPAAAPAAAALGTATILAGLLLVILLRHHKPQSRRMRPRPKSRAVRGAHRKPPRSP
ncbi:M23 family metallopeptidase [Nonomuraea rhodomycinica]|uniref:M23 family metallopeptidase n=1 Tax=Nonomuraea rhodomycinica TaxID=1712872 RepID=A0A7Y6IZ51_9ACTN|nr:M23 family metallopeptidase [Nonomuraea rhodomycinica]